MSFWCLSIVSSLLHQPWGEIRHWRRPKKIGDDLIEPDEGVIILELRSRSDQRYNLHIHRDVHAKSVHISKDGFRQDDLLKVFLRCQITTTDAVWPQVEAHWAEWNSLHLPLLLRSSYKGHTCLCLCRWIQGLREEIEKRAGSCHRLVGNNRPTFKIFEILPLVLRLWGTFTGFEITVYFFGVKLSSSKDSIDPQPRINGCTISSEVIVEIA